MERPLLAEGRKFHLRAYAMAGAAFECTPVVADCPLSTTLSVVDDCPLSTRLV